MKIWTTCTYTPTTLNSLSVRQLKGSVKTLKGLYGKNLKNTNTKILCAQKPRKKQEKVEIHNSQLKDSKRWSENGEKSGANQLYNRMKTLAYEEFCHIDFKREEYDSYSLVLYRTMLNELAYERRNLKYTTIFGDKWRQLSKNKEPFLYDKKLNDIQSRINESIIRCEEFLEKEKEFKKKYFKDENINFDNIIV